MKNVEITLLFEFPKKKIIYVFYLHKKASELYLAK